MSVFTSLVKRAAKNHRLDLEMIVHLLSSRDPDENHFLFEAADSLGRRSLGAAVHLRGIIEFSNICRRDCLYCGLRKANTRLERYRMTPDEILEAAIQATELGYKTIVLQSGEDPGWQVEELGNLIATLKSKVDVAVTVSIGELRREEYELLFRSGAERYLLKHETANPDLYASLHPDLRFADRVRCLKWLKDLGYQVGAGNMIGLPGQTLEDIAQDILFMQELDVQMAGIGPFIPHPDTPLGGCNGGELDLTLKTIAVTRLLLPIAHIPATTAIGSIDPQGREKALRAGANVVMPNITPTQYRPNYQIYPGKICVGETAGHCRACIENRIRSIGRFVASDHGNAPGFSHTRPSQQVLSPS